MLFIPRSQNAFKRSLVITRAVNIERMIPRISVLANPFTVPDPIRRSTTPAMIVVIFPSKIAENAFPKPFFIAVLTVFPSAISSLIRVKMMTFASTAIPIESRIPAIPGSVSEIWNVFKKKSSSNV